MFCSECGQQLEPGARFCEGCGAEVGAVAPAPDAAERRSRLRPGTAVPGAVGAGVLVAVVALLLNGLAGGSSGASNPEAAVRELASALQKRDMAAAIAVIDPQEVGTLNELYATIRGDLGGSVGGGSGAGGSSSVALSSLRMHEERMGAGVVKVQIDGGLVHGTLRAGSFPGGIPRSDKSVDFNFEDAYGPAEEGLYVMTREVDGRWYVSPEMTALQFLVDGRELPQPDFGAGASAAGSAQATDTPEKLLSAFAEAVNARDVSQLLDLVSNEEASAVRPYRAALQDLLSEANGSLELHVTDSNFAEHELGSGLVRLDLTHAAADAYVGSEYSSTQASLKLNGFCVNVLTSEGYGSNSCDTQVHRLLGVSDFFVVARREDGGLRLAPIATLLEYARLLTDKLGSQGVRRAIGSMGGEVGGKLTAGSTANGDLNAAGYAVLAYRSSNGGLLAIDSNQYLAMLGPNDETFAPLACSNGAQLYEPPSPGSYRVVVAAGEYKQASYRVIAEPVEAQTAKPWGEITGTVGGAARIAVFVLNFPREVGDIMFNTNSPVESTIIEGGRGYSSCERGYGGGWVDQVIGPQSLLDPLPPFEALPRPSAGAGDSGYSITGGNRTYLVVSGARGTRFFGRFSKTY